MKEARLIFVCDDDPEVRESVGALLTAGGYRVLEIASGAELLVAVFLERPDAILVDLFMPDMNGWETVTRLKDDPETRHIPVVVLSTLSPGETGVTTGDLAGWLTKPFDNSVLAQTIHRALDRSGATNEPP